MRLKSVICFLLVVLFLFAPACATKTDYSAMGVEGLTSSERLMSYFAILKENGEIEGDYPEFYGGMYYDESNALVVVLADRSPGYSKLVREVTGSETLIIKYAPVSLNELLLEQELIYEKLAELSNDYHDPDKVLDDDLKALCESFVGVGVSQKNNKLFVELLNDSEDIQKVFKKYISSYRRVEFITYSE